MIRFLVACLAAGMLTSAVAVEPVSGEAIEYRLLAASKTSTMQRELDQAAAEGFRFVDMMGGETLGGDEVVTVLSRKAGDQAAQFEYLLLATSKTKTMQRELTEAGNGGFRYVGQSVAETAFGGQEVIVVLERSIDEPDRRYLYLLQATTRTKTMERELNSAGAEGFGLRGLTVSKTAFGGQELVAILMKPDKQ